MSHDLIRVAVAVLVLTLMSHGGGARAAGEERSKEYVATSEFGLRIPEGPVPQIHEDKNFQYFAEYCLDGNGAMLTEADFEKKFTEWSVEASPGYDPSSIVLYPKGPAFKTFYRKFMEGDAPVTYHAEPAHFTALLLCFWPASLHGDLVPQDEQASFKVFMTWGPNNENESLIGPETTTINGKVWSWKFSYPFKVGFKIQITPSKTGRNDIFLGGRLGTVWQLPVASNK